MAQMYGRLQSTRKRALARRQLDILEKSLSVDGFLNLEDLMTAVSNSYSGLASSSKALLRDLNQLLRLGALELRQDKQLPGRGFYSQYAIAARLDWPMEITETKFYEQINKMPQAKTRLLLASW
jgi:hypothetical protein